MNTTLPDLVTSLGNSLKANNTDWEGDFNQWTDEWLKKSGVNTLKLELADSGKVDII